MNTFMWDSSFTVHRLNVMCEIFMPLILPVTKRLASWDYGNSAMAKHSPVKHFFGLQVFDRNWNCENFRLSQSLPLPLPVDV
ncbi:hypothetical protein PR202_ga23159 [Eleusine coracana subsp. coracana]|uniref:Uncharacterized protein n=1 Tax=Eleusine coracana subsp. coracana TaxID=191504 RepID=A0AAV5D5M9_ELECO|nr:hypothetical protein PR202_ga23159 [Eleusine coracana subsp. coracana]